MCYFQVFVVGSSAVCILDDLPWPGLCRVSHRWSLSYSVPTGHMAVSGHGDALFFGNGRSDGSIEPEWTRTDKMYRSGGDVLTHILYPCVHLLLFKQKALGLALYIKPHGISVQHRYNPQSAR
jgi:hypothetical protein